MKSKNQNKIASTNTITAILFVIYMLVLTGIILFKLPFYSAGFSDGVRVVNLIPLQGSYGENGALDLREIVNNVLIFVPLGVYLGMLKRDWPFRKKALSALTLSLAYEVIQFIFALGRTDVTDVLGNTLGGIVGLGLYAICAKLCKSKTDRIITIIALALTVCFVSRFAYLFFLSHFVMGQMHP